MASTILISPTEPPLIRAIGKTSYAPERLGVDIYFTARKHSYGIQRKTWTDLLRSTRDARLPKELGQITSIDFPILLVEGWPRWTSDGEMLRPGKHSKSHHTDGMSKPAWLGMLWSIRARGIWVDQTTDIRDTATYAKRLSLWASKSSHDSLNVRPKPKGVWGTQPDDEDWGVHVLQSFPGVGVKTARDIYAAHGLPLAWMITRADLLKIKGLGKKTVEAMFRGLGDAKA